MTFKPEKIGGGYSVFGRQVTYPTQTNIIQGNDDDTKQVVNSLTTPEAWLNAVKSGRVNFLTVMANEDRIPEEDFPVVVAACNDRPTF